jgi:hypothetical protein
LCEFTVYDIDDPSKKIAEDIVKATMKNGCLTIRKILGESVTLENSAILEVDVSKEQMTVTKSPFMGNIAKLVELISDYGRNHSPRVYEKIAALWKKAKSEGDSTINSLE